MYEKSATSNIKRLFYTYIQHVLIIIDGNDVYFIYSISSNFYFIEDEFYTMAYPIHIVIFIICFIIS